MYQLLAEIESLRQEKHPTPLQHGPHISFEEAGGDLQPGTSPMLANFPHEGSSQGLQDWPMTAGAPDVSFKNSQYSGQPRAPATSLPRALHDQSVSGEDVDACFQMSVVLYPRPSRSLRIDFGLQVFAT
jgi:hypothetical protein